MHGIILSIYHCLDQDLLMPLPKCLRLAIHSKESCYAAGNGGLACLSNPTQYLFWRTIVFRVIEVLFTWKLTVEAIKLIQQA